MKASMHNGREGSGRHNDRTFLQGKSEQERQEMAPHIDAARTADNVTWRVGRKGWHKGTGGDIETAERDYYRRRYGAAQEAKNARYKAQRHPERCKTTDDLYTGRLTRPEEQILQIGSKDEQVSPEVFRACVQDYIKELNAWNRAHGKHMQILSVSVHFDETSPHAHLRRVWEYDSKDGRALGQDKALEAAGVPLPDPGKTKGRHNNRKMSFDSMMRDKWLDICEAHGLQIDREPVPDMRHKDKADFIRDRIAGEIAQAQEQADIETARAETVRSERMAAEAELQHAHMDLNRIREEIEGAKARMDSLKTSVRMLSAAEAARIPEGVKAPLWGLLGHDKVLISRETVERLVQTAGLAEKAAQEAVALSADKRRIEREAREEAKRLRDREKARGEREARALVDRAQEQAGDYFKLRQEVDYYHRLEDRYPEHFSAIEQAERDRKSRQHSQDRNHPCQ